MSARLAPYIGNRASGCPIRRRAGWLHQCRQVDPVQRVDRRRGAAGDTLFATLYPTIRALPLPGGSKAVLSDTVGFISNLPTTLIAAFRATLEEVLQADLEHH